MHIIKIEVNTIAIPQQIKILAIPSSEQTMNDIRKGEEDLKAGRGIEVNLDEL